MCREYHRTNLSEDHPTADWMIGAMRLPAFGLHSVQRVQQGSGAIGRGATIVEAAGREVGECVPSSLVVAQCNSSSSGRGRGGGGCSGMMLAAAAPLNK